MSPNGPNPSPDHHAVRQQANDRAAAQAAPVEASSVIATAASLVLPLSVVTRSDVSRSLRELGLLDDFFHQAAVRGSTPSEMPALSKVLDSLAQANGLNLLHAEHREPLKAFLTSLKAKAPVVHISFPSVPSDPFTAKILEWFRKEVHPHVVLHVGLMPELAAGCLVRTTSKMYDFSLRKKFEASKVKLVASLEALDKAADRTVIAESTATVAPEARL